MPVSAAVFVDVMRFRATLPGAFVRAPLDRLLVTLTPTGAAIRRPSRSVVRAMRVAESVVARIPGVPSTCLYRALGRYAVLRRRGVPVRFVMGVDARTGERAHAWIELDGVPYDETLDERFVETYAHPPRLSHASCS